MDAFATELPAEALSRAALSHLVRQMTLRREWPLVTNEMVKEVRTNPSLPSPAEQAHKLLLYLGDELEFAGACRSALL